MRTLLLMTMAGLLAAPAGQSRAAEDYSACTGYIDSVPAVISVQGTWCLRDDLSTAITGGSAISVAANNVTIDCNHFKLGGLAAGNTSSARGIYAFARSNTTIRNCTIRGFHRGVALLDASTSGALVEDNRFDGNLVYGIEVQGDGTSIIRRNRILDTGGADDPNLTIAIIASAHILDNTVDGVFTLANDASARGIYLPNEAAPGRVVRGNRVRAIVAHGIGEPSAIVSYAPRTHVIGNHVALGDTVDGAGVYNDGLSAGFTLGNLASGFQTPFAGNATDGGGNASN